MKRFGVIAGALFLVGFAIPPDPTQLPLRDQDPGAVREFTLKDFSPNWAGSVVPLQPNESYFLLEIQGAPPSIWRTINDNMLDPRNISRARLQYNDLVRDYEIEETYDDADQKIQVEMNDKMSKYANYIFRNVLSYQLTEGAKKAEKRAPSIRTFREVQHTVKRVTRQAVSINVRDTVKFGLKTDIPMMQARFWMESPLAQSELEMNYGDMWSPPTEISAEEFVRRNTKRRVDHYRLIVKKNLPLMEVQSSVSYAIESTNLTASLQKTIVGPLSCKYSLEKGMDPAVSTISAKGDQRFEFLYRYSF